MFLKVFKELKNEYGSNLLTQCVFFFVLLFSVPICFWYFEKVIFDEAKFVNEWINKIINGFFILIIFQSLQIYQKLIRENNKLQEAISTINSSCLLIKENLQNSPNYNIVKIEIQYIQLQVDKIYLNSNLTKESFFKVKTKIPNLIESILSRIENNNSSLNKENIICSKIDEIIEVISNINQN